jgi:hypothetical protein
MKQRIVLGVVTTAIVVGVALGIAESWSSEGWTALATWVTAAAASAAGIVALGQLDETRRTRREQTQPFVVAYIEPSQAGSWLGELGVRNALELFRRMSGTSPGSVLDAAARSG